MLPLQHNVIRELWQRPNLIIFPTDKNLGPSESEQKGYIQDVLETHLLNDKNYEYLKPETVRTELGKEKTNFLAIYKAYRHLLHSEA